MTGIKVYILLFLLMVSGLLTGQTITIPDENFRTCLLENYPTTLDSNQHLIISEAKLITSSLNCANRGIKNAEGIQFFTSAKQIIFSKNLLTFLPEFIVDEYAVEDLQLNENKLEELPPINNLKKLKTLDLRRNSLRKLPDLEENKELAFITAHSNQLDTLPSLNSLKNLYYLNVAINQLEYLPSMDSLIVLRSLICWQNNLKELPLIHSSSLTEIDASKNQIQTFELLPVNMELKIIRLENNLLTSIPDFSDFILLEKVLLNNNKLTFSDLEPISFIPGYDTIFPLQNQQVIKIGKSYDIPEKEALILTTGVDTNIAQVTYQWFHEGNILQHTSQDKYVVNTDSANNSGLYFCNMLHPAFQSLTLKTDSFYVNISPCINIQGVSTTIISRTCESSGQLAITSFDQPKTNLSYELIGFNSGKSIESQTGKFTGLDESQYILYLKTDDGCLKKYPQLISVPIEDCNNVFITPDGDGIDDTYFFSETGIAKITDKYGNTVTELSLPGEWDGTGDSKIVTPGLYLVNINDGERVMKITVAH